MNAPILTTYAYHPHDPLGGGFGDFLSEIGKRAIGLFKAVVGLRDNLKPSVRTLLEKIGNLPIVGVKICRRPLNQVLDLLVEVARQGAEKDEVLDKKPDKLFHLFLIVKLNNGQEYRLEKNEDINLIPYEPNPLDETREIALPEQGKGGAVYGGYWTVGGAELPLSLYKMLEQTKKEIGDKDFFTYNATSLNCQRFVFDVLRSNGFPIMRDMADWILQRVSNLVPKWAEKVMYFFTSLANRGKMIIEGYGEGTQ